MKPQAPSSKPQQKDVLVLNDDIKIDNDLFPMITTSSNPLIAAIHLLLKIAILAIYLVIPLFTQQTSSLQFVVIAAAVDFWIVKNISGRILVGLRWWVDFDQQGEQIWKFQCKVNEKDLNPANNKVFWWTLAAFSIAWIALVIVNIFRLNVTHISITVFCAIMMCFNLYSYYRCSKVQQQNVKKLMYQYGNDVASQFMHGAIVAKFF